MTAASRSPRAVLIADGHAAGAPTLKRALSAFRRDGALSGDEFHWLQLATRAAFELWHDGAHHSADVFRAAGNCLLYRVANLLRIDGGRQIRLQLRRLLLLHCRQFGAIALLEHLDRLATLFDSLSDHVDWPGLLQTIRETGAERVIATHGYTGPLVRYLREQGMDASAYETRFSGETDEEMPEPVTEDAPVREPAT